jgi:steroid 5-alpha reductase family enzyme
MKKVITLALASAACVAAVIFAASGGSPREFISGADPLKITALLCGGFIFACFILAWATGDYSQTDRLWSIAPVIYAWIFTVAGQPDRRLILMACLATLWGARLSFNFARKGGYTSGEDYRWPVLRKKITHPVAWQAFNLLFVAGYQHIQVFLIALPAYAVFKQGSLPLGPIDLAAVLLFIALLILETAADEQMWRFQETKKKMIAAGEPLAGDFKRGFLASGLYRYSRHPNYFAEIAIWWAFYLFVPAATGAWLHWTIIGAVLLTVLFQGSVWFGESISGGKYPLYAEYRRRVSRLVPWPSRHMEDR